MFLTSMLYSRNLYALLITGWCPENFICDTRTSIAEVINAAYKQWLGTIIYTVTYLNRELANLDKREIWSWPSDVVFVSVERFDMLKSYDWAGLGANFLRALPLPGIAHAVTRMFNAVFCIIVLEIRGKLIKLIVSRLHWKYTENQFLVYG